MSSASEHRTDVQLARVRIGILESHLRAIRAETDRVADAVRAAVGDPPRVENGRQALEAIFTLAEEIDLAAWTCGQARHQLFTYMEEL